MIQERLKMASADTLCKKLLNVKNTVVESHDFYPDKDGVVWTSAGSSLKLKRIPIGYIARSMVL